MTPTCLDSNCPSHPSSGQTLVALNQLPRGSGTLASHPDCLHLCSGLSRSGGCGPGHLPRGWRVSWSTEGNWAYSEQGQRAGRGAWGVSCQMHPHIDGCSKPLGWV